MRFAAKTLIATIAVVIAACNPSGGPSARDLQNIYSTPVNLVSCAKVNDSTYRCRFTFANPRVPADQGEHVQCFITDGTTWDIKIFC
jgi:hypothetical protein